MKNKVFFENIDGLRFFCFLSVFFYHSFHTDIDSLKALSSYQFITKGLFSNGNLGVNFFFVLSGFLITFLLITEKEVMGKINTFYFWLRRILRIWPLFYFCVFFGFFIFPILKIYFGQETNETANLYYYLTFLNNFDLIQNGLPDSSILGVLWSIAIEEQFYFIWPILLAIFPVKRYWVVFSGILLTNIIFRYYNPSDLLRECHTISCIGDMAIGAFGAWLTKFSNLKKNIENLSRLKISAIYVLFILIYFFRAELLMSNAYISVIERLFISTIMLFVILEQNYANNSFFKLKNFKLISNLGKITYGLYCLHFVGILITLTIFKKLGLDNKIWHILILHPIVSLVLSIALAKASYHFFEKPFLRLKNKFSFITK